MYGKSFRTRDYHIPVLTEAHTFSRQMAIPVGQNENKRWNIAVDIFILNKQFDERKGQFYDRNQINRRVLYKHLLKQTKWYTIK